MNVAAGISGNITTGVILSSSLRSVGPETTLARARRRASALGITRVTDITRLDRVGIPVYASIRPGAADGSLCVNAGKGLRPIEAEVGAYMEAIEFALAEPGASQVTTVRATARDVLDGRRRPEAVLDLCPKLGARIRLDAPMDCVQAEEITTGERALVPAELVFLPYRPRARYRGRFGSSSNGLSSGNTLREATVHGVCELVERDVRSFQAVRDTSVPVALDSVEGPPAMLVHSIRDADLQLFVRTATNVFGMPYFTAVINDPDACSPQLLNAGYGCHPHRSVAFVRAVAEAAQSRLSFIHGGRDDLLQHHQRFHGWSVARKRAFVARVVGRAAAGTSVPLECVQDHRDETTCVEDCERFLLGTLASLGFDRVYRIAFCAPDDELQVVRVIVPRLELFHESLFRVGPRLRDHANAS
jgi:ribosomal protein S12 methylthiotransferase accessory factor